MTVDAGLLTQHGGDEAFPGSAGAGDDEVLMLLDPSTVAQTHQLVFLQVAFHREVDILQPCAIAHAGVFQQAGQSATLPFVPLRIHQSANASKHKSVRCDRAGELEKLLLIDIEELFARAEKSDPEATGDDQQLPQKIARREALLEKMRWAREELEKRAKSEDVSREEDDKPQGPEAGGAIGGQPKDFQQINLTDPESALMRKSKRYSYEQAYNAQAVVDAEGSQLVLATDVLRTPSDANQLEAALDGVVESVGPVQRMLADGGYVNAQAIDQVGQKVDLYVAITSGDNSYRRYDYRPPKKKATKKVTDPRLVAMREKVTSKEGKRIYGKRASTVEPVFGTIKAALGLRQFLLRGLEKVRIEWDLACLAYNMRRLWSLSTA